MKVTISDPFSDLTAAIYMHAPGMWVILKGLAETVADTAIIDFRDRARAMVDKIEATRLEDGLA